MHGLETPLQFIILAHEIGHAIQKGDPVYAALSKEQGSHISNTSSDPFGARTLEVVQDYVPDHGIVIPVLGQLIGLGRRYEEVMHTRLKSEKQGAIETRRLGTLLTAYAFAAMTKDASSQVPVQQFLEQRGMKLLRANIGGQWGSLKEASDEESYTRLATILQNPLDTRKDVQCFSFCKDEIFYVRLEINNEKDGRFETVFSVDLDNNENPLAIATINSKKRVDDLDRLQEEMQRELQKIEKSIQKSLSRILMRFINCYEYQQWYQNVMRRDARLLRFGN